jgi:hypothetical protein
MNAVDLAGNTDMNLVIEEGSQLIQDAIFRVGKDLAEAIESVHPRPLLMTWYTRTGPVVRRSPTDSTTFQDYTDSDVQAGLTRPFRINGWDI